MITAICNIYINSKEKEDIFKETFPQVYKISNNWLIYIRGSRSQEIITFIKSFKTSKQNCIFFKNLYDNDWAKSTMEMLKKSKYKYVYTFLEDHFLQKPIRHFQNVIQDTINNNVDYFPYSFFNIGLSINSIEHTYPNETNYFQTIKLTSKNLHILQKTNKSFYPYSLASICSKKYFTQLLNIENKLKIKVPFTIQALMENIYFFYPKNRKLWFNINQILKYTGLRFVIYSPATPFNLEKSLFDCEKELLPIKVGVLKEELFANWDDDNKLNNTSLIKRGLYPNKLKVAITKKPKLIGIYSQILKDGESKIYQFCPDVQRTSQVPLKYIQIKEGSVNVSSKKELYTLKKGQGIWVNANISHQLTANRDSVYNQYYEY